MAIVAVLLFVAILLAILLGYPVAVALGGMALVCGYVFLGPAFMQFLPSRLMGVLSNYVLLAVPMFVLMGLTLQRSGLAETLLRTAAVRLSNRPGGLAMAVLVVGALLAASTGIVGASVVTLTLIAFPVMREAGYRDDVSSGIIAAAGSLGQIVPPSIVLILLGSVMQISVGGLFQAAMWPSIAIVALYACYIFCVGWLKPDAMPVHGARQSSEALLEPENTKAVWLGVLGTLALIVGVLGSILLGIASPTEASGVGAVAAFVLLFAAGKGSWTVVIEVSRDALRLTAMIFLILLGATTFALVFRGLGGDAALVELIQSSGLSAKHFLLLLLVVVFVAGFFIDFIEIIFIVVPITLPVIEAYELDPVWVAMLLAINLQTSFLSPPFGFSLFYLRGAAPANLRTVDVYRGAMPYVAMQLIVLVGVFVMY